MTLFLKFKKAIAPLVNIIGKLQWGRLRHRIDARRYDALSKNIEIGDVLLSKSLGRLSNCFIPGFYKHAAICVSPFSVVEATSDGVIETTLFDFCASKDYVKLIKPTRFTKDQVIDACDAAYGRLGKKYDFIFEDCDEAFYCTELIVDAYVSSTRAMAPMKRNVFGAKVYVPDDLRAWLQEKKGY